jgi:hypothetical protein
MDDRTDTRFPRLRFLRHDTPLHNTSLHSVHRKGTVCARTFFSFDLSLHFTPVNFFLITKATVTLRLLHSTLQTPFPLANDSRGCGPRELCLLARITTVKQAGEDHFRENIRRYVTATPFGIEVFGGRGGHCFIYGFSSAN